MFRSIILITCLIVHFVKAVIKHEDGNFLDAIYHALMSIVFIIAIYFVALNK